MNDIEKLMFDVEVRRQNEEWGFGFSLGVLIGGIALGILTHTFWIPFAVTVLLIWLASFWIGFTSYRKVKGK